MAWVSSYLIKNLKLEYFFRAWANSYSQISEKNILFMTEKFVIIDFKKKYLLELNWVAWAFFRYIEILDNNNYKV